METKAFPGLLGFGPLPRTPWDVQLIADWGANLVLSVLTIDDLQARGASALPSWLGDQSIAWLHLPIPDLEAPDENFDAVWDKQGMRILARLRRGQNVFVHCVAGLGRSGTVVARLLIDAGSGSDEAVVAVRRARPDAIETEEQEMYLHKQNN